MMPFLFFRPNLKIYPQFSKCVDELRIWKSAVTMARRWGAIVLCPAASWARETGMFINRNSK